MPEVRCPNPKCHGALMVLRVAKKGPNKGKKFYGCSNYPECKMVIPFESVVVEENLENEKRSQAEISFPRTLRARARFSTNQVRFFETVAVPEDLLEIINTEEIDEEILESYSQWRVEFPIREFESNLTTHQSQIISVIEKILTRGRTTLPSPELEKEFRETFLKTSKSTLSLPPIKYLAFKGYRKFQKHIWLDSKEETNFYENILPQFLGENYEQFVIPQVEILSLLPPNPDADITGYHKWVDFAVFHPLLEEKIVIEIDGEQHKEQIEADKERDRTLQEFGYTVIRIPANEVQKGIGADLSDLQNRLFAVKEQKFDDDISSSDGEIIKFLQSIKIAHQIQIILLQTLQNGFLNFNDTGSWDITTDIDELGLFNKEESLGILKSTVNDFINLLENLCKLYSVKIKATKPLCNLFADRSTGGLTNKIHISFTDKFISDLPTFHVQNIYFPFHIANSTYSTTPVIGGLEKPEEKDLGYFLRYLFRKPYFWEGQYYGLTRILQGKDALILLTTGGGKSLIYQLASFLLPGRTVVIQPLISLMDDQIDNLALMGIDRCIAITGQIIDPKDKSRAIGLFAQGEYLFAFVAPERFQIVEFRNSLRTLTVHTPVALIVVDEAHCVSEWGHDFRTAYLNIGRTSREYCKFNDYIPPLLALTGTASRAVLKDVQRELQITNYKAVFTPESFDRPELEFIIMPATSQEKIARLKGYLSQKLSSLFGITASTLYQTRGKQTNSGLIFCPWVDKELGVVEVTGEIRKELNIHSEYYSGGAPNSWENREDEYIEYKQRITKEFKRNKIPLLVCTTAFGMGIDKPNIRYTIHLNLPSSVESFYQEVGRAGRDQVGRPEGERKHSYCCIIVSNDDPKRTARLLDRNTTVEEIEVVDKNTPWKEKDDIIRKLFFHINAFRGIAQEKEDIQEVLQHLGDISKKGERTLAIPKKIIEKVKKRKKGREQAMEIVEKTIYRLLLIGVLSDYTIDYDSNQFQITLSGATKEEIIEAYKKYIEGYSPIAAQTEIEKAQKFLTSSISEFVMKIIDLLLNFIYEVIERGRRHKLNRMLWCATAPSADVFRKRFLTELMETEYSKVLDEIIIGREINILKIKDLFSKIVSENQAAELRGQVSRYLGDYPDHPSLLMLFALSEVFSADRNILIAKQYYAEAINKAKNYRVSDAIFYDFVAWGISKIAESDKELASELTLETFKSYQNRLLARKLTELIPISLKWIPAWFLLTKLKEACDSLVLERRE